MQKVLPKNNTEPKKDSKEILKSINLLINMFDMEMIADVVNNNEEERKTQDVDSVSQDTQKTPIKTVDKQKSKRIIKDKNKRDYVRFTQEIISRLNHFYELNNYPTKEEIEKISQVCGYSEIKVDNWFKHKRRLQKKNGQLDNAKKQRFSREKLQILKKHFVKCKRPTFSEYTSISQEVDTPVKNIQNWFAFKRKQLLRKMKNFIDVPEEQAHQLAEKYEDTEEKEEDDDQVLEMLKLKQHNLKEKLDQKNVLEKVQEILQNDDSSHQESILSPDKVINTDINQMLQNQEDLGGQSETAQVLGSRMQLFLQSIDSGNKQDLDKSIKNLLLNKRERQEQSNQQHQKTEDSQINVDNSFEKGQQQFQQSRGSFLQCKQNEQEMQQGSGEKMDLEQNISQQGGPGVKNMQSVLFQKILLNNLVQQKYQQNYFNNVNQMLMKNLQNSSFSLCQGKNNINNENQCPPQQQKNETPNAVKQEGFSAPAAGALKNDSFMPSKQDLMVLQQQIQYLQYQFGLYQKILLFVQQQQNSSQIANQLNNFQQLQQMLIIQNYAKLQETFAQQLGNDNNQQQENLAKILQNQDLINLCSQKVSENPQVANKNDKIKTEDS